MKKRKILLSIIVIFFMLIGIGLWYLNNIFLPVKVKSLLVETLAKEIKREVILKELRYQLFRGFVLSDLTIFEEEPRNKEFLKIERISLNPLFLPLLKERKFIIPTLDIDSPTLNLIRDNAGRWNFSSLITPKEKKTPETKAKFSTFIRKIAINDGQVSLEDNLAEPALLKKMSKLELVAYLDLPLAVKFKTSFEINPTLVTLQGEYDLIQKSLNLNLTSKEIILTEFSGYYKTLLPFELLQDRTDINLNLSIDKDKKLLLAGTISTKGIHLKKDLFELKGDSTIKGELTYLLGDKESLRYNGELLVNNFLIKGLPFLKELENLKGGLLFSQDNISIERLEGIALDCPIQFRGELKELKTDPSLNLTIESKLDLVKFRDLVPDESKDKLKDIELTGEAKTTINLSGKLKEKVPLEISGDAFISGASLKLPTIAETFRNISGNLSFGRDSVSTKLAFEYKDIRYQLNGSLKNFAQPDVEINLTSKDISIFGKGALRDNNLNISQLEGRYKDSPFQLAGEVNNLKDPYPWLNIDGEVGLNLEDLGLLMPNISDTLAKLNLKGRTNIEASLKGKLKEPKNLEVGMKAQSERIYFKTLKLDNLYLDFRMKNESIDLPTFRLSPYDGNLLFSASADLALQNPPYTLEVQFANIDLKKLTTDTPLKEKNISGLLEGKITLGGYGKNLETLRGNGSFKITGGQLWEVPLLKGLAEILNLTGLEKVVFKEATGSFSIANKYIVTKDLRLLSDDLTLAAEGALGFDSSLDFTITTTFSQSLGQKSQLGKITTIIADETGNFLGEFKLRGTVSEPKWTFSALPLEKILKQKVKGLLEGIFE